MGYKQAKGSWQGKDSHAGVTRGEGSALVLTHTQPPNTQLLRSRCALAQPPRVPRHGTARWCSQHTGEAVPSREVTPFWGRELSWEM